MTLLLNFILTSWLDLLPSIGLKLIHKGVVYTWPSW
jgi:hypothetical protein